MNKTLIALVAASLFVPFAIAEHDTAVSEGRCGSDGTPALGIIPIETEAGTFYIDDRNFFLANGIWVYEETNDVAHLQRGGASDVIPDDAEICTDKGDWDPDRLIL